MGSTDVWSDILYDTPLLPPPHLLLAYPHRSLRMCVRMLSLSDLRLPINGRAHRPQCNLTGGGMGDDFIAVTAHTMARPTYTRRAPTGPQSIHPHPPHTPKNAHRAHEIACVYLLFMAKRAVNVYGDSVFYGIIFRAIRQRRLSNLLGANAPIDARGRNIEAPSVRQELNTNAPKGRYR